MANNWLLVVLFFVYPLVVIGFNCIIRVFIPCKNSRKEFLLKNDYFNMLVYLLMPLLVFHLELLLIFADYPFYEINRWVIVVLVVLQSYLFLAGVFQFLNFFGALKKYSQRVRE